MIERVLSILEGSGGWKSNGSMPFPSLHMFRQAGPKEDREFMKCQRALAASVNADFGGNLEAHVVRLEPLLLTFSSRIYYSHC